MFDKIFIQEFLREIFEPLKYLSQITGSLILTIMKLKKIIRASLNLNPTIILTDTFGLITKETCSILECDRTSVFLIDHKRGVLWNKGEVGKKVIMVQLTQGIAGWVARNGKSLNILDAYQDHRFNPDNDKLRNYKTKSVLCVPIMDQDDTNVVGVIQAINKLNNTYFTKDDEGVMLVISKIATSIFKNSLNNDTKTKTHNTLRKLLAAALSLHACKNIQQMLIEGERILV